MCSRLFTAFVLYLTCHAEPTQQKRKIERSLQWNPSDSHLRLLSEDLSDMDHFKSSVLRPLLVERVSGTDGNKGVQNHIKSLLTSWQLEEDTFVDSTPYGEKTFTNIIATLNPLKQQKIVLACHFDSKYFPEGTFLGATDSAVPCGILLQTAMLLQCFLEKSPVGDVTLQLIFFDGEEAFMDWTATDSLYGAQHLADRWASEFDPVFSNMTRLDVIREFILLDLIGTSDTSIPQQFDSTAELYRLLVNTDDFGLGLDCLVTFEPTPGLSDDNVVFFGNDGQTTTLYNCTKDADYFPLPYYDNQTYTS